MQIRIGGPITPVVKIIMILIGIIFIFQQILNIPLPGYLEEQIGLSYIGLIHELKLWQIGTYMFLHGGWFHVIFNLIGIWMFAGDLEQLWGSRQFLKYFLVTGVGAGVFITIMNYYVFYRYNISPITIGASGAIYGILIAYGITWPNRTVMIYFILPVKIKYLVLIFGLIEFFGTFSSISGGAGNISQIGHLGGLVTGAIYILFITKSKQLSANRLLFKVSHNPVKKALKSVRIEKKKKEIQTRIKAKEIIDMLLEKIAREGMTSLTHEERKLLEWARKHYYPEEKETIH